MVEPLREDAVLVTPVLTDFQVQLLARAGSGETLREAANEMHFSYGTAYNHMRVIKKRLGARTLSACVMRAYAMGYLSHPTGADYSVVPVDG